MIRAARYTMDRDTVTRVKRETFVIWMTRVRKINAQL